MELAEPSSTDERMISSSISRFACLLAVLGAAPSLRAEAGASETYKCELLMPSMRWPSEADLTLVLPSARKAGQALAEPPSPDVQILSPARGLSCSSRTALRLGHEGELATSPAAPPPPVGAPAPTCRLDGAQPVRYRIDRTRGPYAYRLQVAFEPLSEDETSFSVEFGCARFSASRMLRFLPAMPLDPGGPIGPPPRGPAYLHEELE